MWTRVSVLVICAVLATRAGAQQWMLVEARDLPAHCTDPLECIPEARLLLRNMIRMYPEDRQALTQFLNRVAIIRGIPETAGARTEAPPSDIVAELHALPMAEKVAALVNHPGVYFDATALDKNPATAGFAKYVHAQLSQAGVRFLNEEEMAATPGRPRLSVSYKERSESEGCIVPFSVSFSILEETVMVRNPALKTSGAVFAKTAKENLANRNYTPMSALQEAVTAFLEAWREANPG